MWGCLRVGARSPKQKKPNVTSRKAPLAIRHSLSWQRQLRVLVMDVADLLIDRPDFQLLIWQCRSSAVVPVRKLALHQAILANWPHRECAACGHGFSPSLYFVRTLESYSLKSLRPTWSFSTLTRPRTVTTDCRRSGSDESLATALQPDIKHCERNPPLFPRPFNFFLETKFQIGVSVYELGHMAFCGRYPRFRNDHITPFAGRVSNLDGVKFSALSLGY
jgi:hypothetical protein